MEDQRINPNRFRYKIVAMFPTKAAALEREIILHRLFDVKNNPSFYNKANQSSLGFDATGMVAAIDALGNSFFVSKNDNRLKEGILFGANKGAARPERIGKFAAKCAFSGKSVGLIDRSHPKFISGEYISSTIGRKPPRIPVLNSNGEKILVERTDPGLVSGELKRIRRSYKTGSAAAKDKEGNSLGRIPLSDERWISGEIVNALKGVTQKKRQNFFGAMNVATGEYLGYIDGQDIRFSTGEIIKFAHKRTTGFGGRSQRIEVNGTIYDSIKKAAIALKIHRGLLDAIAKGTKHVPQPSSGVIITSFRLLKRTALSSV